MGLGRTLQGYLAHKKEPTPLGPPYNSRHRLRQVPRGGLGFMSEVPLYRRAALMLVPLGPLWGPRHRATVGS